MIRPILILVLHIFYFANAQDSTVIDLSLVPGDLCFRNCKNALPRVCYFDLHMEHYHVLGP